MRWKRVPVDADVMDHGGGPIIRITRGAKGDAMASVERLEWFEPDGHEYTGYAEVTTSDRRPAGEVLAAHRKARALITIEDVRLWDKTWGELTE